MRKKPNRQPGNRIPGTGKIAPQGEQDAIPIARGPYVYNGVNRTPWYSNATIRRQLNLNDNQYGQLNADHEQAWIRYNEGANQLGDNLTAAERTQRMQDLTAAFNSSWTRSTNQVVTDPNLRNRFHQLSLQYQHYGAFNDPVVQHQLNLTEAQRQKLSQWDRDWNKQMAGWHNDFATNRQSVNSNFSQMQRTYLENLNSTLTPQQREQWQVMTGKPMEWSPDYYFQNAPVTTTTAKPVLEK